MGQILFSSLIFCWTQKRIWTYLRFLLANYKSLFHVKHLYYGILFLDSSFVVFESKCINIDVSGQTNTVFLRRLFSLCFGFGFCCFLGFWFLFVFICQHCLKYMGIASQLFPAGLRLEWTSWSFRSYKVWKWNLVRSNIKVKVNNSSKQISQFYNTFLEKLFNINVHFHLAPLDNCSKDRALF